MVSNWFATPSVLARSWRYRVRGRDICLSFVFAASSIHSNQIKDVWSVWARWSEYQHQLSKCIVVSRKCTMLLRDWLARLKRTTITYVIVVNQVNLQRTASRRHHSLALLTLRNLNRMQAQPRHRQVASSETPLPNRHRQAVFLAILPLSLDRQAVFLAILPLSLDRQAVFSVIQPNQHRPLASLATPPPSPNKEACSAQVKIKLEIINNSNKAPLSSAVTKILSRAQAFLGHSKAINRLQVDYLAPLLSSLSPNKPISSAQ